MAGSFADKFNPHAGKTSKGSSSGGGFADSFNPSKGFSPGTKASAGKTGFSAIQEALKILDLPRSAIVNTIAELHGSASTPGKHGKFDAHELLANINAHKGVGDYVHSGNKWADRGIGFAGDVALDPLTYLGGGAKVAASGTELGFKEAARKLLTEGADKLGEDGAKSAAARVLTAKSAAVLKPEELEAIGAKSGFSFGLGKKLRVDIPKTEALARGAVSAKTAAKTAAVEHVPAIDKLGALFATNKTLREIAKTRPVEAFQAGEAIKDAARAARSEKLQLSLKLGNIAHDFKDVDGEAIRHVLEGGVTEEPRVQAAADALRGWFDESRQRAEQATGRSIGHRENYLPWQFTKELRDEIGRGAKAAGREGKVPLELRKTLMDENASFLGKTLEGATPTERRAEIEAIAKDTFGPKYKQVFKSNPWELANGYLNHITSFTRQYGSEKALEDAGLAASAADRAVASPKKLAKQAKFAGKASDALATHEGAVASLGDIGSQIQDATAKVSDVGAQEQAARAAGEQATTDASRASAEHAAMLGSEKQRLADAVAQLQSAPPVVAEAPAVHVDPRIAQVDQHMQQLKDFAPKIDAVSRTTTAEDAKTLMVTFPDGSKHSLADANKAVEAKSAALDKLKRELATASESASTVDQADVAVRGAPVERVTNDKALQEAQGKLADAQGRQQSKLTEEVAHRQRAADLFAQADKLKAAGNEQMAQVATLEGLFEQAEVTAHDSLRDSVRNKAKAETMRVLKTPSAKDMLQDGLKQFANGHWAEAWVVDAMHEVEDLLHPKNWERHLKTVDWVTTRWKAYALLSPGFHMRNLMGGMFNNTLAGVDSSNYLRYARYWGMLKRAGGDVAVLPEGRVREAFEQMVAHDIHNPYQARDIADILPPESSGAASNGLLRKLGVPEAVDPTSTENLALKANRKTAATVEQHLRGTLFLDRYTKTGSVTDALDAIDKYHFDYGDLSDFEKRVVKRVVPFYTWTRKNFPLQLEMMAKRPGVYTAYLHAQHNLEVGVPTDDVVPNYYGSLLAIRSPFKSNSGDRIYFTPDLPFRDLAETFDANKVIGQLNPLIKTPLEAAANKQFFSNAPFTGNLHPVPVTFLPVAEVLRPFMGKFGLPKVQVAKGGHLMMTDKDLYKIEQMLPVLGRLRRQAPSEKKYQDRALTTWLSFLTGLGSRTLSQSDVDGELRRRGAQTKQRSKVAKALGY